MICNWAFTASPATRSAQASPAATKNRLSYTQHDNSIENHENSCDKKHLIDAYIKREWEGSYKLSKV